MRVDLEDIKFDVKKESSDQALVVIRIGEMEPVEIRATPYDIQEKFESTVNQLWGDGMFQSRGRHIR